MADLPALYDGHTGEVMPIPANMTSTALHLPDDITFDQWADYGRGLDRMVQAALWWLGDWWVYGGKYGDRRHGEGERVALGTPWSYQTCADAGWVARSIEFSRRREILPWSYHKEVAALEPPVQDRFLDRWAKHAMSHDGKAPPHSQIRAEVKEYKRDQKRAAVAARAAGTPAGIDILCEAAFDVIPTLADQSVALLLTDPPYAVTDNDWDIWDSDDDYWQFMKDWLARLRPKMAVDFTAFIFCDADASVRLCQTLMETGWPVLRQVIWHRPNLAKKRADSVTFLSAYEPFWHAGTRALILPDEWGEERFDVQRFTVPQSTHVTDGAVHPTQKPLALMRRLVSVGSHPGELVFDPFCGAGTTALACHREQRPCITCDTNPEYVQIAKGRLAE